MVSNSIPLVQTAPEPAGEKLAHTKALLTSIYRENKPEQVAALGDSVEPHGSDVVDTALVNRVVQYLVHEQEDELKKLLKESFGSPDDVGNLKHFLVLSLLFKFSILFRRMKF